jgi:hypothetical protein
MLRRWLIRGICIALLTLCVTAWVGSYWQEVMVFRHSRQATFIFDLQCGEMVFYNDYEPSLHRVPRWEG